MSFDRLGRFAVRRRWWIVAAWAVHPPRRPPVRAPGAGRPVRRRLHPRRPRVGPRQAAAPGASSASSRRRSCSSTRSDTLTAGTPRVARRRRRGDAGRRRRPARDPGPVARPRRRARSAPTATPRTTSCSSTSRPTTRPTRSRRSRPPSTRSPGSRVRIAGGPAFYGDVQAVTESDLRRSELISLPLAALALLLVFGSLVAAGVPLAVGGAAVLVALAGIFLVASRRPDEHLRAQPRDAARPRAWASTTRCS